MKYALPVGAARIFRRGAVLGAVGAALATAGLAAPVSTSAGAAVSASAVAPRPGTLNIVNRKTSLTLEAGDVGASGNGKVFSSFSRGNNTREQQWNFINGGKLVSRQLVGGKTVCLETDTAGKLFVARCVGDKQSQKWAFKLANDAPGAFQDAFRIQNFATKKCLVSAEPNERRNARVGVGDCKADNLLQQWFASNLPAQG